MKLILGDCIIKLKELHDNSVDAIVTDPPYGLSFMGKKWDYDVPSVEIWQECLRVLKPGGYLLSFAGTRTQHRMAVRIEDAGFEIRDMIAWIYGSGFPKSLNIGKKIDQLQGNERKVVGKTPYKINGNVTSGNFGTTAENNPDKRFVGDLTKGNSPYEGWGTALKPAFEPITLARKPLSEKTVAKNVLKWGTGGINIDGCRVGTSEADKYDLEQREISKGSGIETNINFTGRDLDLKHGVQSQGRFPANIIHDGSDEVVGLFPNTETHAGGKSTFGGIFGNNKSTNTICAAKSESGSASRFFYCAKASKSERNRGCEGLDEKENVAHRFGRYRCKICGKLKLAPSPCVCDNPEFEKIDINKGNNHPTVKPIALMEYLVKLVSREGATVLDPFMGSGSTGIACKKLNREFIGIEMEKDYIKIAKARIENYDIETQTELEF